MVDPRSEQFKRLIEYIGPQFVWGYATGKGITPEDSIVFFCKDEKTKHIVLVVEVSEHIIRDKPSLKCPAAIRDVNNSGGLSIFFDETLTLDKFYNLAKKTSGPKNVHMAYNGFKSEEDGSGEIYYCYKRDWLVMFFH